MNDRGKMITLTYGDSPVRFLYTAKEAVERYIALRLSEGLVRESDTWRHIDNHLRKRLLPFIGPETPLNDVTADHLREWRLALETGKLGQNFSPVTVRHHLVDAKTFFKRCHGEGWIDRNPSMVVKLPIIEEEDVNIISVPDAQKVFAVNRNHRSIGRLALEAFGGVRCRTAGLLQKENIKFEELGIEMPSVKHKSKKRVFRQGHPENLWLWLKHAPEEGWGITYRQYVEDKKEIMVNAGLRPWILKTPEDYVKAEALDNVWRHSFASYLLALTKNFGPVRYLMQHTTERTTHVYEGKAFEREAKDYFLIGPAGG